MMRPLAVSGYSESAVLAALRAPLRTWSYRYELLNAGHTKITDLPNMIDCTVTYDALADIKRTARFNLRQVPVPAIDPLSHRIKPHARLAMPDGGHATWPLGVFLLNSPTASEQSSTLVTRDVQAYDVLQVLTGDKIAAPYYVAAGAVVTSAITELLANTAGIPSYAVTASATTFPAVMSWETGTTKLSILNDMIGVIGYTGAWADADGVLRVQPYTNPANATPVWTYSDTDTQGLLQRGSESTQDFFDTPNLWVAVVSDPDRATLRAVYRNDDPGSPTSTISRGRTITDTLVGADAANQSVLDVLVQRRARESLSAYETVSFSTAALPLHEHAEVLTVIDGPLGIHGQYSETSWSLPLKAGATMTHTARRAVSLAGSLNPGV